MNFLSDTTAPAHPAVLEALARANTGYAPSYGADPIASGVKQRLKEIFETDLEVLFTASGSASNALALSVLCPGDAAIVCHDEAHIHRDERGAPEFFTGGAKLLPMKGDHAKIPADGLEQLLKEWPQDFVHTTPPRALSLSQLNESGCAYTVDEIKERATIAHAHGLAVHMDGARFANALVHLDCTPAGMTWKSGVDALSLGATKNGAMMAEAVILFPSVMDRFSTLQARQKRAGHMYAKMRFIAAQFEGWLTDDLWLDLARTANARGKAISKTMSEIKGAEVVQPTDGNEVFARLDKALAQKLREAGVGFYSWPDGSARFVASWCTSENEVAGVLRAALG